MTLSLAASENVGGLHAAIADRLEAEDDARREWLNRMVHGGGRCRYCGAKLSDKALDRTPGVCAHPNCQRKGRREARETRKLNHNDEPAAPAEGAGMPRGYARGEACKTCGSTGTRHRVPCSEDAGGGGAPVKAEKTKAPEGRIEKLRQAGTKKSAPSRAAAEANVDAMEIVELVELRGLIDEELSRRRGELEEQLAAVRVALGTAA